LFVKALELRKRELRRKQLEANRLVANLAFETAQRRLQDAIVIERERWRVPDREPRRLARIGGGPHAMIAELGQRVIGDRNDATARITVDLAERIQLLEEDPLEAGFLSQLAASGVVDGFIDVHETAG